MKENRKNLFFAVIILILAIIGGLFLYANFDFLPICFKKPIGLGLILAGVRS